MRVTSILSLFVLPLLAAAQSPSPSVQLTTVTTAVVTLGSNRQESTFTTGIVMTVTPAAAQPSGSTSGNSTVSGNSTATQTGNSTSSASSTVSSNLPTAASTIADQPDTAPSPGASGAGGVYGPGDGYIAAANTLKRNLALVGLVGCIVGGGLVFI